MPFGELSRVGSMMNHVLDGGRGFGVVEPTEKHRKSLLRCMQQKDHSIFNNGTTRDAIFRQKSSTTCLDFIHLAQSAIGCLLQTFSCFVQTNSKLNDS